MASNVLQEHAPSAPSEGVVAEQQHYAPLYPTLPNAETFRLGEISRINKEMAEEAQHYRLVLTKYKKAQKALSFTVAGLGVVTTAMSLGAVASALTGVGIVVAVPLGAVGNVCGAVSTGLVAANKKVENKVNKHARTSLLVSVEHTAINALVSKALDNNSISDAEFKIITHEMEKYRKITDALHHANRPTSAADLEKIREEVRDEMRKKIAAAGAALN